MCNINNDKNKHKEDLAFLEQVYKTGNEEDIIKALELLASEQKQRTYLGTIDKWAKPVQQEQEQEVNIQKECVRCAARGYERILAVNYDKKNPYTSLAKAANAEYEAFISEREELNHRIDREQDRGKQQKLELQRDIESAEYMALTSSRIARTSEVTQGSNAAETVKQYKRAEKFHSEAQALWKIFNA